MDKNKRIDKKDFKEDVKSKKGGLKPLKDVIENTKEVKKEKD